MAVAKFEFTPYMPTLAKIEVKAPKRAAKKAKSAHILLLLKIKAYLC